MTVCRHCGEAITCRDRRGWLHADGSHWRYVKDEHGVLVRDEDGDLVLDHYATPKEDDEMTDPYLVLENAGGRVIAPDWPAVASLHQKLARAMGAMGLVVKDKRNTFHNYDYASHDAVSDVVSTALADVGLGLSVSIVSLTQEPLQSKGSEQPKGAHVLVEFDATFMDGETGAMKVLRWYGEASDTGDKAVAKACTSGVKFLLARNLLISTGDADADSTEGEAPTTTKKLARKEPSKATPAQKRPEPKVEEGWETWGEKGHRHYFAKAGEYELTDAMQYATFGVKSRKEIKMSLGKALQLLELVGEAVIRRALPFKELCTAWGIEYPAQIMGSGLLQRDLEERVQKRLAELLAEAEAEEVPI